MDPKEEHAKALSIVTHNKSNLSFPSLSSKGQVLFFWYYFYLHLQGRKLEQG